MLSVLIQAPIILFLTVLGWWWFSVPWLLWLAWQKSVWPLIIIAIIWDAYTGGFFSTPVASLLSLVIGFVIILIKPRFLMYNQANEVV